MLVLGNVAVLLVLLQFVHHVATDVPHRDARFFRIPSGNLGQLRAPFLAKQRDRDTYELAVDRWIEPEIRFPNRAFHRLDQAFVPDLNRQHAGLGRGDRADLIHRHLAAIGFHGDRLQQADGGAAGSQPAEFLVQNLDGPFHPTRHVFSYGTEIEIGHFPLPL